MLRTAAELVAAACLVLLIAGADREYDAAAPEGGATPVGGDVVAAVGDAAIRRAEVELALQAAPDTPAAEVVRHLLEREILYAAAKAEGMDETPGVRSAMVSAYLQKIEETAPALPEADVRAWYAAHAGDFALPERRLAAVIWVRRPAAVNPEEDRRLRERAEEARAEAVELGGRDFGAVAARVSDHAASRFQGGRFGWLRRDAQTLPRAVMDALFSLTDEGAVAPSIEDEDGYWLVKLVEKAPGRVPPFEEVSERIVYLAGREEAEARRRRLVDALGVRFGARVDTNLVARLDRERKNRQADDTSVLTMPR